MRRSTADFPHNKTITEDEEEYMYKIEMHLHTIHNSHCGQDEPADIAKTYAKAGYNGIVVTNHFNRTDLFGYVAQQFGSRLNVMSDYMHDYYELKDECAKYGIDVFLGLEAAPDFCTYYKINPPYAEILVYGITPDELLKYGYDILNYDSLEEFRDRAKESGWLLIAAHPYRAICTEIDYTCLDGIEIANLHPYQNSHNEKAEELCNRLGLIPTGGSDFHFEGGEGGGLLLKRAPENEKDLVGILRSRQFEVIKKR